MFRSSIKVLVLALGMLVLQCGDSGVTPNPPRRELNAAEKKLVSSDNRFGLKLFREIVSQENLDRQKNIVVSPLSVGMALGMTYNGAAGSTQEAMQKTLELQGMSLEEVNQAYCSLIDLLQQLDPAVKFQIANSIWNREDFSVEQPFIDLNRTYFDAVVRALDFRSPEAVTTINAWVNENTNGKIETIIREIDPMTVMFLINAIYFKGMWEQKFDRQETIEGGFRLPNGTVRTCTTMVMRQTDFPYFATDDFEAIDLAYGTGDYSMSILLPRYDKDVDMVIGQLTDENWQKWMNQFSDVRLDLLLPRFKFAYELKLNDVLKALGMEIAFTGGLADFSGINAAHGRELFISEVKHKSFVAVDEDGTEAAAVTSVAINLTSLPMEFRVDRPFIFAIREHKSGTILFMAKIVDPIWNEG